MTGVHLNMYILYSGFLLSVKFLVDKFQSPCVLETTQFSKKTFCMLNHDDDSGISDIRLPATELLS